MARGRKKNARPIAPPAGTAARSWLRAGAVIALAGMVAAEGWWLQDTVTKEVLQPLTGMIRVVGASKSSLETFVRVKDTALDLNKQADDALARQ